MQSEPQDSSQAPHLDSTGQKLSWTQHTLFASAEEKKQAEKRNKLANIMAGAKNERVT